MNATATLPPEVAEYLDRVRAALADVPADERDEMLADLEVSLLEGAEDSVEPPEARLGPPERFARELRAAAGLTEPAPAHKRGLLDQLRDLAEIPRVRAALQAAHELAPAWWFARGAVAAGLLGLFFGTTWSDGPGFLLTLLGIAGSVWLGLKLRRQPHRRRRLLTAANVVLAVLAIPIGVHALQSMGSSEIYYEAAPPAEGVALSGHPVSNIYPYSRDGKLLLDVLLFDELGRPLDVGTADPQMDPERRYLYSKEGGPILNSFPIRYTEPATTKVKDPKAAPTDIEVPEIVTPPLKVKRP